jgi:hypothetical protein
MALCVTLSEANGSRMRIVSGIVLNAKGYPGWCRGPLERRGDDARAHPRRGSPRRGTHVKFKVGERAARTSHASWPALVL